MGALLAALLAAQLDLAIGTGGNYRSGLAGQADTARLVDVQPSVTALLDERGLAFTARYAPMLWTGDTAGVRHDALLLATWDQTRNLRFLAQQRVRYGPNEAVWDPGMKRPFDALVPLVPIVRDELAADTELGFGYLLSRTLSINAGVGYLMYGGASAASQQLLPLQQGPQLYAGLDQELTRNDRLSTSLYASQSWVSGGTENSLVELTGSWERRLAAATQFTLSGGASVRHQGASDVLPVATLAVRHELPARAQRIELRGLVELKPQQSPLTGQLVERAGVSGAARWILREELWLRVRGAAAQDAGATRLYVGAVDASWKVHKELALSAGVEAFNEDVPSLGGAATRWLAFTALTFRPGAWSSARPEPIPTGAATPFFTGGP